MKHECFEIYNFENLDQGMNVDKNIHKLIFLRETPYED